jgi:hypothetical protein
VLFVPALCMLGCSAVRPAVPSWLFVPSPIVHAPFHGIEMCADARDACLSIPDESLKEQFPQLSPSSVSSLETPHL